MIQSTFENKMGIPARSVKAYDNVPNNQVYRIETDSQPYIFKVYCKRDWPEDGKLLFVNRMLNEHRIPHAKIHVFDRDDENFPNGYLIEDCLPGTTADRLSLSKEETVALFTQLAALVSQVHRITLDGYGYTGGSGIAEWRTQSEFFCDSLNDNAGNLLTHKLITPAELESVGTSLSARFKSLDCFPPVLCHGDLSTKNMLIHDGVITLIDWDDVQSHCWMVDISRMTFWMKINYEDAGTAEACRDAFLSSYETGAERDVFYETEDVLHIWHGLDWLNYLAGTPAGDKVAVLLREIRAKSGI